MTKEVLHINGVDFLPRKYVMDLFKISNVTMARWIKQGILRHHRFGKNVYFIESEIEEDIKTRDYNDMTRKISPLKKADDAIEVDSSNMNIDEVVETIKNICKEKM